MTSPFPKLRAISLRLLRPLTDQRSIPGAPRRSHPERSYLEDPVPDPDEVAFVSPGVRREICDTIGRFPAESGGVLLGPADRDGISRFVFDRRGSSTQVSFSPSHVELTRVCERYAAEGLELKGFCHSHPELVTPSGPDMEYAARFFEANDGMNKFYMPIMPRVPLRCRPGEECDTPLAADGRDIFFWVVYREDPTRRRLAAMRLADESLFPRIGSPCIVPEANESGSPLDLELLESLCGNATITANQVAFGKSDVWCVRACGPARAECLVLIPDEFPTLAPTLVVTDEEGRQVSFPFAWSFESPDEPEERIAMLVEAALRSHNAY